jgi:hypothetical protein
LKLITDIEILYEGKVLFGNGLLKKKNIFLITINIKKKLKKKKKKKKKGNSFQNGYVSIKTHVVAIINVNREADGIARCR